MRPFIGFITPFITGDGAYFVQSYSGYSEDWDPNIGLDSYGIASKV